MRIGLFTDTYPPYINGVSTSIAMLKHALEKQGHQVFVVTVNNELTKYAYEENGRIIRIPGVPTGIYDYRLTGIYPIRCINKIKKWKLDIIHSHTEFGVGTFARIVSNQLNIPLVHTYHTMYEDHIQYITHGHFKKSSDEIVKYLSLFYCDKTVTELIVPTKKTYDLFKEKYKVDRNIYIVPTGIDIERFYKENVDMKKVEALREKFKIEKSDFIMSYIGRLGAEKSTDVLVDVLKDVYKKHKHVKLLIVGDGPDKDKLEKLIMKYKLEEQVIFTGKVPWEDIPFYYHLGDVFITASRSETQGLTVIEAMAAGDVPICIHDESFINVVIDDLNGKIFKTKKECAKVVCDLIEDKKTLKRLASQARNNAERHSSKYYAESVMDVYQLAIKNKKGRFGWVSMLYKKVSKKG